MLRGLFFVCSLSVAGLTGAAVAMAVEPPNAAHLLAQKFAEQTPPSLASQAQVPAQVQAPVFAPKVQPHPAKSERPPIDYEMEMLRRARAEQATAMPPPSAAPVTAVAAPVLSNTVPLQPAPALAPPSPATTPASPAAAVSAALPPTKTAETAPASPPAPAKAEVQAKADPKPAELAPAAEATSTTGPRGTLLLALETSATSSKNAPSPTFDPMICMADICYISAGLNADAVKLSKLDALKLKSTSDASPDSCNGKVGCVFRNVMLPAGAQVQVVELGSASHDLEHTSAAQLDPTCKVSDGDLNCDNPILTKDFKIWSVPEETARTAGVQNLEDALADGLPHIDAARATDK